MISQESICDQMEEGIQIIDRDFRYIYVNDAVVRHGRTTREFLLGSTMSECYPGIEKTLLYEKIGACMSERRSHQMVNEFVYPDGSLGYFQLRIQPVPEGVLIISFEITEQHQVEVGLRELTSMLEGKVSQATTRLRAKNAELEQLAYIASHDLQEPLRTIHSHVQVLMEDHLEDRGGWGHAPTGADFSGHQHARHERLGVPG